MKGKHSKLSAQNEKKNQISLAADELRVFRLFSQRNHFTSKTLFKEVFSDFCSLNAFIDTSSSNEKFSVVIQINRNFLDFFSSGLPEEHCFDASGSEKPTHTCISNTRSWRCSMAARSRPKKFSLWKLLWFYVYFRVVKFHNKIKEASDNRKICVCEIIAWFIARTLL